MKLRVIEDDPLRIMIDVDYGDQSIEVTKEEIEWVRRIIFEYDTCQEFLRKKMDEQEKIK